MEFIRKNALILIMAVIAVIGFVWWASAAKAADKGGLPNVLEISDAPPGATWTGFYVGAHAGHGWADWSGDLVYDAGNGPVPNVWDPAGRQIDAKGWFGGGQAGFNKQIGSTVFGIEVDGSWTNVEGDGAFLTKSGKVEWRIKTRLDALGTVRGRLGFTKGAMLVYGTAGLAVGRTSADLVVTHLPELITATGSATENHVGWTAGGGVEWMMGAGWSLKAEYLYVDLGKADYRLTGANLIRGGPHTTDSFPADLDMHIVRAGLNYRF